jgi:hypothetical protein
MGSGEVVPLLWSMLRMACVHRSCPTPRLPAKARYRFEGPVRDSRCTCPPRPAPVHGTDSGTQAAMLVKSCKLSKS